MNTNTRGRSYAPRGQTPVSKVVGSTRQKLSMISTVNNQGKARWMIIDGNFNHERLIACFESLVADTERKVFLILDNLGVPTASRSRPGWPITPIKLKCSICPATARSSIPMNGSMPI